jgi:DNA-binding XRE family transcriptional regulator
VVNCYYQRDIRNWLGVARGRERRSPRMIDAQKVGERARGYRLAKGLKREEVAVLARVSVSTVDNLEQGRALPRIETVERVADVLGVTVSDLLAALLQPTAA